MTKVYHSVTELIGNTPLLEFDNFNKLHGLSCRLMGKLEFFNPAGSVKDRTAKNMIEDAERTGLLTKDSVIIEPTSGNTGIGLAAVSTAKGYRIILTMPETMSLERRRLLKAYGAEVVLTKGEEGIAGAVAKAKELSLLLPNAITLGQFESDANPEIHRITTGPEIWYDTDGQVSAVVAGVGTGGTITGVGEYLKQKRQNIEIVAVEPKTSPLLSGGEAGAHGLQGIGANFIPSILNTKIYNQVIPVSDEDAYRTARELAHTEGVLVGISSGAALFAAKELGKDPRFTGKIIVAILPDNGERYLSTPLFE